jgi:hypothetical protein
VAVDLGRGAGYKWRLPDRVQVRAVLLIRRGARVASRAFRPVDFPAGRRVRYRIQFLPPVPADCAGYKVRAELCESLAPGVAPPVAVPSPAGERTAFTFTQTGPGLGAVLATKSLVLSAR